jgi:hypothetical protein
VGAAICYARGVRLPTLLIAASLCSLPALDARAQEAPAPEPSAEPSPAPTAADEAPPPEQASEPTGPATTAAIQPVAATPEPSPPRYTPPLSSEEAQSRYPDYVVGGVISLIAGVGLGVGCGVAAATGNPKTALGLGALATTGLGVGVPLVMLGAADEEPEDEHLVGAGIVIATPGVIAMGLGGTVWGYREAGDGDHTVTMPVVLLAGGAVALVAGVVTYVFGASHRDEPAVTASLGVGPGSLRLDGRF